MLVCSAAPVLSYRRLANVTDGTGVTTAYAYDALNDLTSVTQSGQQRTFLYTSLGHLQSATNPENGTIAYTYDDSGNLASRTDARGLTTTSTYGALNRLQTKAYSDGVTAPVTMVYDGAGAGTCPGNTTASNVGRLTGAKCASLNAANF